MSRGQSGLGVGVTRDPRATGGRGAGACENHGTDEGEGFAFPCFCDYFHYMAKHVPCSGSLSAAPLSIARLQVLEYIAHYNGEPELPLAAYILDPVCVLTNVMRHPSHPTCPTCRDIRPVSIRPIMIYGPFVCIFSRCI